MTERAAAAPDRTMAERCCCSRCRRCAAPSCSSFVNGSYISSPINPACRSIAAGFSVVKLVTDKATGEQWACKIMSLPPPGKQYNENESSRWVGAARQYKWVQYNG